MPAKRLKPKRTDLVEKVMEQLDPVEDEPLMLTCTDCGAQVERTAHSCPHCGALFYQRPGGKGPLRSAAGPHKTDPDVADFARRMDYIEKWTRILCVIGGVVFALLALLSLWGMFAGAFMGGRAGLCGLLLFSLLAAVCLARGLKGEGAELGILDKIPGFRTFRLR
jgi:hypothetical protein